MATATSTFGTGAAKRKPTHRESSASTTELPHVATLCVTTNQCRYAVCCTHRQPSMCRFMVHSANQYNMAKRLQKTKAALLSTKTEQQEHATIAKMSQAAFSEAEVNAAEMEMSIGTMVVFGNIYQLLNTASDRFLAVERIVAEEDTSAVKVALQDPAIRTKCVARCPTMCFSATRAYLLKSLQERLVQNHAWFSRSVGGRTSALR